MRRPRFVALNSMPDMAASLMVAQRALRHVSVRPKDALPATPAVDPPVAWEDSERACGDVHDVHGPGSKHASPVKAECSYMYATAGSIRVSS